MMASKYNPYVFGILLAAWSLGFYYYQNEKLQLFANAQTEAYKAVDALSVESAAKKLYLNGFEADLARPPAYPLLIGVPLLFNVHYHNWQLYIHFINIACWLSCILLLFSFIAKRTNTYFGLAAGWLLSIQVGLSALNNEALTEPLFILLLSCFIILLYQLIVEGKKEKLPSFGLIMVLLYLTRPIFFIPLLLFLSFLSLQILYQLFEKNISGRYLLTLSLTGGILLLHTLNMKRSTGAFALSNVGTKTYYVYLSSKAFCLKNGIADAHEERNKRNLQIDSLPYEQRGRFIDSIAKADCKFQLRTNAFNLFKTFYRNIVYDNGSFGSANLFDLEDVKRLDEGNRFNERRDFFCRVSEWENYLHTRLALVAGLLFLLLIIPFRRKSNAWYCFMLAGTMLYLIGISGLAFWQGDRYHVVVTPITIALIFLMSYKIKGIPKILFSKS